MELPETIRKRLDDFSRNILFDQTRTVTFVEENNGFLPHEKPVLSSLQLQMSLYFNMWFFPCWWISETVMLHLKYPALPEYYKFILVTILLLMTLIEAIRLYLGYAGNLQEKVPELAGFWLLTTLLQLPLILFQLFNEAILIQPLERGVHIVLTVFILIQVWAASGFAALRNMVRHTGSQLRHPRLFWCAMSHKDAFFLHISQTLRAI
uniref:Transmembrane protein 17 n=1 Tax=Xiphophorus couchianus TaxID=32473 RepID=A0A3B5L4Q6_9TELE